MLSTGVWFLPAGLRLATLAILPVRLWWPMAAIEWAAAALMAHARWGLDSPLAMVCAVTMPWLIYAGLVHVAGRTTTLVMTPQWMGRQLTVGLGAAVATGLAVTLVVMLDGVPTRDALGRLFAYAVGDLIGVMTVAPLLLVLREHWIDPTRDWAITLGNGTVALPALCLVLILALPGMADMRYPVLISSLPLLWIAHRHGWRACAVSLGLIALGRCLVEIGFGWAGQPLQLRFARGQLELFAAVIGAAALLVAANADAVRVQSSAVRTLSQRLWAQAQELRATATRLASQQEQERRHLGAELHDALGQDMTAIATRLRLLQRRTSNDHIDEQLEDLRNLVTTAHGHLRDAINHLHPVSLTRFGLVRALTVGPVAEMVRNAGVRYDCVIRGPVPRVPADIATMLYRIAQEAATNAVRHGCGGFLQIEIALEGGDTGNPLTLRITDHAGELQVPAERLGHGLQSIRDRADALGAAYRFNARSGLPRHWLQMRVPALEPDASDAAPDRPLEPTRAPHDA
ncbi:hypothetical protein GCM10007067_09350 [Lysobacter bugurensis]|uniref:histidine kinase n=2 Tax=Cognatilysobacter bugurensis TaxID=543356 RepID=A0A918W6R0_9GAMM|nr:hypothetical protein GCM10007067_09350 [Lysobacter bugurensis]